MAVARPGLGPLFELGLPVFAGVEKDAWSQKALCGSHA